MGNRRFTALSELRGREFRSTRVGIPVRDGGGTARRQFILVNNTRPLPKALVYELLPKVGDLPQRMSNRSQAALVTEALNYKRGSSLKGLDQAADQSKGRYSAHRAAAGDHEFSERRRSASLRRRG